MYVIDIDGFVNPMRSLKSNTCRKSLFWLLWSTGPRQLEGDKPALHCCSILDTKVTGDIDVEGDDDARDGEDTEHGNQDARRSDL